MEHTAIGTGWEDIWRYRVPFISTPEEDYFGYAGDEHYDIETPEEVDAQMAGDGREQGHVIFHPEQGEIIAWPHDGTGRTPEYLRGSRAEQIKEMARARWDESLSGGWLEGDDDWHTAAVVPEEGPWQQSGYPNWDTQEVGGALEGNWGAEEYEQIAKLMQTQPTQEQFEMWMIQNIIAPYNLERQKEADEWNAIPQHDRLDYSWESLKEQHPQSAGIVDALGFGGGDVSDVDLNDTIIDERKVDWDLLYKYALEDFGQRTANSPGADSWTTPSNTHTQTIDTVDAPKPEPRIPCYCDVGLESPHEWTGSCENGKRPVMRYEAGIGSNWVYIEGQVAFGRHWFQIAQELLTDMGADEETIQYVSNTLARNALPDDMDIAIGSTRNSRVQIWESTVDRNAVWDAVSTAKAQQTNE